MEGKLFEKCNFDKPRMFGISIKNLNFLRFFVPKNRMWAKRILLVFLFVLFDYAATVAFCSSPSDEGNLMARIFMEAYGIAFGLALFDFLINVPVYVILCLDSHLPDLPPRWSKIANAFTDFGLALFVAGLHFHGGMSWLFVFPNFSASAVGATAYITLAAALIDYKIFKG
ncbi:MAG: hypothetical protein QXZ25_02015 [Candidatus Bathyarchaeia archaeon]